MTTQNLENLVEIKSLEMNEDVENITNEFVTEGEISEGSIIPRLQLSASKKVEKIVSDVDVLFASLGFKRESNKNKSETFSMLEVVENESFQTIVTRIESISTVSKIVEAGNLYLEGGSKDDLKESLQDIVTDICQCLVIDEIVTDFEEEDFENPLYKKVEKIFLENISLLIPFNKSFGTNKESVVKSSLKERENVIFCGKSHHHVGASVACEKIMRNINGLEISSEGKLEFFDENFKIVFDLLMNSLNVGVYQKAKESGLSESEITGYIGACLTAAPNLVKRVATDDIITPSEASSYGMQNRYTSLKVVSSALEIIRDPRVFENYKKSLEKELIEAEVISKYNELGRPIQVNGLGTTSWLKRFQNFLEKRNPNSDEYKDLAISNSVIKFEEFDSRYSTEEKIEIVESCKPFIEAYEKRISKSKKETEYTQNITDQGVTLLSQLHGNVFVKNGDNKDEITSLVERYKAKDGGCIVRLGEMLTKYQGDIRQLVENNISKRTGGLKQTILKQETKKTLSGKKDIVKTPSKVVQILLAEKENLLEHIKFQESMLLALKDNPKKEFIDAISKNLNLSKTRLKEIEEKIK